jgi:hypothetical protein
MPLPTLLFIAPVFLGSPTEPSRIAFSPPSAAHAFALPRDDAGDPFEREVAEEGLEDDDGLSCDLRRPLDAVGPAIYQRSPSRSPLPNPPDGRQRPQRAPPAP